MRRLIFFAVGLLPSLAFAAAKKPERPEVLVVSAVRSKKAIALRPTKEHPINFIVLGGTERTLGDSIAGEPMPDRAALTRGIAAALVSQGFTLTQLGGPVPPIAVLFSYGSANLSTAEINDTDPTTGETTSSTITFNRGKITARVGTPTVVEDPPAKAKP